MNALTRFFFRDWYLQPSTWNVLGWWESRRVAYNVAVGAAGVASLGVMGVAELVAGGARPFGVPLAGVVAYGIAANLFYSLGPLVDAAVCGHWGAKYSAVGPALFRYGFVFAVGLTLLPIPIVTLGTVLRLLL